MFYGNEIDVGNGIRQKIEEKVVKREHLFLVSKVRLSYFLTKASIKRKT